VRALPLVGLPAQQGGPCSPAVAPVSSRLRKGRWAVVLVLVGGWVDLEAKPVVVKPSVQSVYFLAPSSMAASRNQHNDTVSG
jgi:hypothetical protein